MLLWWYFYNVVQSPTWHWPSRLIICMFVCLLHFFVCWVWLLWFSTLTSDNHNIGNISFTEINKHSFISFSLHHHNLVLQQHLTNHRHRRNFTRYNMLFSYLIPLFSNTSSFWSWTEYITCKFGYKVNFTKFILHYYCLLLIISIPCALKCTWRISEFAGFDQMMRIRKHLMEIKALTLTRDYNAILALVSGFSSGIFKIV